MKLFNKFKRTVGKGIVLGALAVAVLGGAGAASSTAHAYTGRDCGSHGGHNAVINCGGDASQLKSKYFNGDGLHSLCSIHEIYAYFGISADDMRTLPATSQAGYVTKSGEVHLANGTLVATDAVTAGHDFMSGSTSHKDCDKNKPFNTRTPSVSFGSSSLPAVVVMKDGVFQFALLKDCGNPIKAQPKKPAYEVKKEVREKNSSTWHTQVTVDPGEHVIYKVIVTSTGQVAAKNINVRDDLPSHVQYVNNTLKRNGNKVPNDSQFFGKGLKIDSLAKGKSVSFTFEAIVGPHETATKCSTETLTNKARIDSPQLPPKEDTAKVKKECKPHEKPSFACVSLTQTQTGDLSFNFQAKATATKATITSYNYSFGDGKTANNQGATISHTYDQPGTYTAQVTAIVSNGKTVTSEACKVTVKPQPPVYSCDKLTPQPTSDRNTYSFTAQASASNGATVTGYNYSFGDGKFALNQGATVSHTYEKPGNYDIAVAAVVTINAPGHPAGEQKLAMSEACKAHITVTPPETPAYSCDLLSLSKDDNSRTVTISNFKTSATNGAVFTKADIDWNDGTPLLSTANVVGQKHTFAADGNYTVKATAHFTVKVNGVDTDVTASGPACQATVSFNTPEKPAYSCDLLKLSQNDDERSVTITDFKTSATNGAVFTKADINWGDNTAVTTTDTAIGQTHGYAKDGNYTISATAHFTVKVNGVDTDVTASGPNCLQSVNFNAPPETPPQTPPMTPPTTLVNTGAGSVAGLVAVATAIGAYIHRRRLSSKLEQ